MGRAGTANGNGRAVFVATDAAAGSEPWVTDGTAAGTTRLADIAGGTANSSPGEFFPLGNGRAVFAAAGSGGWWPVIRESFPGAWQRNVTVDAGSVSSFHAFWACSTLIASDVAKLRTKLVQQDAGGVWSEFASRAY